ncbi:MAG: family 10 glycosylhydrolase [Acidobacteriota bacterium]|nr:family 10 glycosylhydrolase [Acidobacteriota bacterium]
MRQFPTENLASRVVLCLAALLSWGGVFGCQTGPQSKDSLESARRAAVERPRRVIFNNDGDDLLHLAGPATAEKFLSVRTDHAAGTMVDSVFYFSRRPISPLYTGSVGSEPLAGRLRDLSRQGTDDLSLVIEASRRQGMEVFWSMRMNDIHDNAKHESEIAQWKKDHRHLLMGRPADKERFPPSDPRNIWTFVDYAHPEVRDLMVETFKEVLTGYDVDGVDLDFLRHPAFFVETRLFKPVTRPHLEMMSEMVGRIRAEVLAASRRKGRPILMSVRVLPTLAQNRHFGFDVEQWARRGYLDLIVVGGGYDPFTMPAKDMIDSGNQWGVPVYVCLSSSGFEHALGARRFYSTDADQWGRTLPDANEEVALKAWRAAAANAWLAGARGIMTFNLFPRHPESRATRMARRVWKEIGDPEGLALANKLYVVENVEGLQQGFMMGSVPIGGRLPVQVAPGDSVQRLLPVADDLAGAGDRLDSLELRLKLAGPRERDTVTVRLNGERLRLARRQPDWLIGPVPAQAMRRGINVVKVELAAAAASALTLAALELEVTYRR